MYSGDGVNSLITEPSERSWLRIGRPRAIDRNGLFVDGREILAQDFCGLGHVGVIVADKDRTFQNDARERF